MNEQLLVVVGISGGVLLLMLSLLLLLKRSLREVPSGHVLMIRSISGEPKVCFERSVVIPLLQSAELLDISAKPIVIERGPARGLRCADGIRASLRAVFVVRVNPTAHDVPDIDELRAGLDERIRQLVRLVQSQS